MFLHFENDRRHENHKQDEPNVNNFGQVLQSSISKALCTDWSACLSSWSILTRTRKTSESVVLELKVKGKGILFYVGGQTGKDCFLTQADGVKVAVQTSVRQICRVALHWSFRLQCRAPVQTCGCRLRNHGSNFKDPPEAQWRILPLLAWRAHFHDFPDPVTRHFATIEQDAIDHPGQVCCS